MNTLEILKAAKEKIATEATWTNKVICRDKDGNPCGKFQAVQFSSFAALWAVNGHTLEAIYAEVLLQRQMGGDIFEFEDNHTHAEVIQAWDKAIAEATICHEHNFIPNMYIEM
jgi:hypothetical protein